MRNTRVAALLACGAAFVAASAEIHGEDGTRSPGGATSARSTAEVGFEAIRKAAADKDLPTLTACLPAKLVEGWQTLAEGDGRAWRAALAARIGDGSVVWVHENGDAAIARWKAGTPPSVWEIRLAYDGKRWVVASPGAYSVGGAEFAKINGRGAAKLKLRARTDPDEYGPSAFSFVHVTQDPKQCKNRMDVCYCRCGQLHFMNAMASPLNAADIDKLDGLQTGGESMDEIVPKNGAAYLVNCQAAGRGDVQVAIRVTSLSVAAIEFEWRVVAAGLGAPASIRAPQPLVTNDGADGTAGICGARGK